jgi:ribose transport system substrate-binding protein
MRFTGKVMVAVLILAVCTGTLFAGGGSQSKTGSGMKVGMSVLNLSNPTFAGASEFLKKMVEADGGQLTYMECKNNLTTQINQVENFVSSGCNLLVIEPAAAAGIEAALKAAKDKGVKVFVWDETIDIADVSWVIDNYSLGTVIGEQAAKWINEKLGGTAEVAILDYPEIEIIIRRAEGIVDAIKKNAPNAKIVAQTSAVTASEGIAKIETVLQSNPNLKVIASIGGGAAIGANEAIKAAGKLTPDFGIFEADGTPGELEAISRNEAIRMTVVITGTMEDQARDIYGYLKKLHAGESVPKKVFRDFIPVTKDNYQRYMR